MKCLTIGFVILFSQPVFAQASAPCNWATESNWSCSQKSGGSDSANIIFSQDWKSAKVTSSKGLSGEFGFLSSDGKNDIFSDHQGNTLQLPSGSCNSGSFDVSLNNEIFSCF